jgi:hypothetical protein
MLGSQQHYFAKPLEEFYQGFCYKTAIQRLTKEELPLFFTFT